MRKLLAVIILSTISVASDAQVTWQQTNGPFGGSINAIAISSSDQIFAGTQPAGMFCSTDNGSSWREINQGLPNLAVAAIIIDSSGRIYAGVGNQGIFRSTDNGSTWTRTANQLTGCSVSVFQINSLGYIFAGSDSGLFSSKDYGEHWNRMNSSASIPGWDRVRFLTITPEDEIWYGSYTGYYVSIDTGETWTRIWISTFNPSSLVMDSSGNFMGAAMTGLYKSTDRGVTWQQKNATAICPNCPLIVNSKGHLFAGGLRAGVMRSTDGGENWVSVNSGPTDLTVNSLAEDSKGNIVAGTGAGVFFSADEGGHWTEKDDSIVATSIECMVIASNNDVYVGPSAKGIYKSTNGGDTWVRVRTGLDSLLQNIWTLSISPQGHIFAWDMNRGASRSTDNGNSWAPIADLANVPVNAFAFKSDGYAFAGGQGIYRSSDGGEHWTGASNGLVLFGTSVYSFAVELNGDVFAGTLGGVFRSTNNGDNWTSLNSGFAKWVLALALKPTTNSLFAACGSDGLFRSTDNGLNWQRLTNGLDSASVGCLAVSSDGNICAGTVGEGVFVSTDNGQSWAQWVDGLSSTDITALAINSSGYLFAGTSGRGVFSSTSRVTSVPGKTVLPSSFVLQQNYPNPFNPSTMIGYEVPTKSLVALRIYDVLGRVVATLVDEFMQPGTYEARFDGRFLPSGVYFYRLQAGSYSATKKLLLLK